MLFFLSFSLLTSYNNRALFIFEIVVQVDDTSDQFLSKKAKAVAIFVLFILIFGCLKVFNNLKKGLGSLFFSILFPLLFLVFIRVQEPQALQEVVSRTKWTRSTISCRKWRSWTIWTSFLWILIIWVLFPALPSISRVKSINQIFFKANFFNWGLRIEVSLPHQSSKQKTEAEST